MLSANNKNYQTESLNHNYKYRAVCEINSDKIDFINSLPCEVLMKIFKLLEVSDRLKMNQVCSFWSHVNELSWDDIKTIDCSCWVQPTDRTFLIKAAEVDNLLANCGRYLINLTISEYTCDSSVVSLINDNCHKLIDLDFKISMSNIHREDCNTGLAKLTELKSLTLKVNNDDDSSSCSPESIENFSLLVMNFPKNLHNIFFKCFNKPFYLTGDFSAALKQQQQLRRLSLQSFEFDEFAVNELSEMTDLSHLDLKGCLLYETTSLGNLTNLEYLDLSLVYDVDEELINNISDNFKKLKYLDLYQCHPVSAHVYQKIANLESLEYLNLNFSYNFDGTLKKNDIIRKA